MSIPAENAATVREALDVLYHYTSDQSNPPGNGRSETRAEGLAAVRALLAQATVRVPPEALGMVTVYDDKGEYAGCMGAETWAWLLAHPDLDASALAALLAQAEAGAEELDDALRDSGIWQNASGAYCERMVAAEAGRDAAVRERDQAREALHRLYQNPTNPTALALARAALTGDRETT